MFSSHLSLEETIAYLFSFMPLRAVALTPRGEARLTPMGAAWRFPHQPQSRCPMEVLDTHSLASWSTLLITAPNVQSER